ncbi:MAG: helix-turn-helix transcriptional regulator [Clostridia bacterium]|nr:helix-turn-helix transcriptional regulator [Clostridia bacterium]
MNTGLKLKQLRRKNGYTREEIAELLGISKNTISNYESNKTPIPLSVMIKLSRLYDFDVFDVFGVHDSSVIEYDMHIYYYVKAHFEYVIRHQRKSDLIFGNEYSESFYAARLKKLITEHINDPVFIKNYPDAREAAKADLGE